MGRKGGAHGGYGREDVLTVAADTPHDDGAHGGRHHPNGVFGVGFVTHHSNEQERNENAPKAVHCKHDKCEHRIAETGEHLSNQSDQGGKDGNSDGHHFCGCVFLTPFRLHVVRYGGRAGKHLAVSR